MSKTIVAAIIILIAFLWVFSLYELLSAITNPTNIGHFIKSVKEASK